MRWLKDGFDKARAAWRIRTSPWRIPLEDLPPGLEKDWRDSAPHEYLGIRTDAFFFACAAEGLMMFFAAASGGVPCALPSEAADSVWHAWLRRDSLELERFCHKHFGAAIPHIERAGLGTGALLNTFVACRRMERARGRWSLPPRLFALDERLCMPDGHGYWRLGGEIMYARLDALGLGMERARVHPELQTHAARQARAVDRRVQAVGGGSCGSSCASIGDAGSAAASCDAGGGDGGGSSGGDAGCSCGSSCGSSCGGGGD
jgi:hypothetical protein